MFRYTSLSFAIVAILSAGVAGAAPLQLVSDDTTMTSENEQVVFRVVRGSEAVPATSAAIVAPDYAHLLYTASIDPEDRSRVVVRPVPGKGEDGSFTLTVRAGGQTASARFMMRLPGEPSTFEVQRRGHIYFSEPATRTLGSVTSIDVSGVDGAHYTWKLNGEVVAEGPGVDRYSYVAMEEGQHDLSVVERLNDVAHTATLDITVVPEPVHPLTHPARSMLLSAASFGVADTYSSFSWYMDDAHVGDGPQAAVSFPGPGTYRVVCVARDPIVENPPYAFRKVRVEVTVP